jgi:heat shock protein HtpX
VAATIGGAITMLADMAMWGMIFGGLSGDDEDDGIGGMVGGIVMIIVAPIAAMIIQMAISRAREFTADATGAEIAGDPIALASALEKIEAYARGGHQDGFAPRPATSHMYIIPPLGGGLARLFSTHPDTQERIARLHAMQVSGIKA